MLSDVPHDSETEFGADPYEIEDDLEEEPDFVPIDMSAKGGNLFYLIFEKKTSQFFVLIGKSREGFLR